MCGREGMHGRGGGHAWWGASGMAGGPCVVRGCMAWGMRGRWGVHGRYYEIRSMSGRYASYWNAFLSCIISKFNSVV